MIDGATRLLGLIGYPVEHSLSPRMHNHALRALGANLVYVPLEVVESDLPDLIRIFPKIRGVGCNVTTPHKKAVGAMVRPGDEESGMTGIVNTVLFRGGDAIGFSTDGAGLQSWMSTRKVVPPAGGIILLGFGAVSRSIAHRLGRAHPLTILSRDPPGAAATLESWYAKGWPGLPARCIAWSDPVPSAACLLVGAIPGSFARSQEVAAWLGKTDPGTIVVDLNYGAGRTPLRDQARDRGLAAYDGIGLLVHQAAISLGLWLGRDVDPTLLAEGLV